MSTRPRSVSFIAISFVVISIIFTCSAWQRFIHFHSQHERYHLFFGLFLLVLAILLFLNACGLWRLSARSRVAGMVLSAVVAASYFYVVLTAKAIFTDLRAQEAPEMVGGIFALIAFPLWFLSPIYILTRPKIRNVFDKPNVA